MARFVFVVLGSRVYDVSIHLRIILFGLCIPFTAIELSENPLLFFVPVDGVILFLSERIIQRNQSCAFEE